MPYSNVLQRASMIFIQHGILEGQVTGATVRHQELLDRLVMLGGLMQIFRLAIRQTAKTAIARLVLLLAVLLDLPLSGTLTSTHALQISTLTQCHGTH